VEECTSRRLAFPLHSFIGSGKAKRGEDQARKNVYGRMQFCQHLKTIDAANGTRKDTGLSNRGRLNSRPSDQQAHRSFSPVSSDLGPRGNYRGSLPAPAWINFMRRESKCQAYAITTASKFSAKLITTKRSSLDKEVGSSSKISARRNLDRETQLPDGELIKDRPYEGQGHAQARDYRIKSTGQKSVL